MANTQTITVRVSEEDKAMIQHYSNIHGISSSELLKKTTLEKIEDDIDLDLYHNAMREFKDDNTTYTTDEVDKMLGF